MWNFAELDRRQVYLDHAAATPLDADVYSAMQKVTQKCFANPSSLHLLGRESKDCLNQYRKKAAQILEVSSDEIIFTGSGTESDNLAIKGVARAHSENGKHIIVSAIEHKAVLESVKDLEKEGFEITYIPVDSFGVINECALLDALRSDTILVSVMYANNEIWTIQDIKKISRLIKKENEAYPIFHTDACQAVGYLEVKPKELGVDMMTINSSKIYGPNGVGMLYKNQSIEIKPMIAGGDQEAGFRAGTENISLIAGFTTALEKSIQKQKKEVERLTELQTEFMCGIKCKIPGAAINGHTINRLPHNIHISIPCIEGESLLLLLDKAGVACSTSSACSSKDLEPSHVLLAIGQDSEIIHGSLRFTIGRSTTRDDLRYTVDVLVDAVKHLSSLSALTSKEYENKK